MADPWAMLQESQRGLGKVLEDYQVNSQRNLLMQIQARKNAREEGEYQMKREARDALRGVFDIPTSSVSSAAGLERYRLSDLTDGGTGGAGASPWGPYPGSKSSDHPLPDMPTMPLSEVPAEPASSGPPKINPEAFKKLLILDPETAFKVSNGIAQMDKATRETEKAKNEVGGSVAMHLESFKLANGQPDMARRQAEWESMIPDLLAGGFTREGLAKFDLSDEGLQRRVAMAMDVKSIFGQQNADRTFQATQADRAADNARADAQFGETKRHHGVLEGQGERRIGIASRNSAVTTQNADAVTPSKVVGPILAKIAAGQPLTPAEAQAFNAYKSIDQIDRGMGLGVTAGANIPSGSPLSPTNAPISPRPAPRRSTGPVRVRTPAEARALPKGTVFITPDGKQKVR